MIEVVDPQQRLHRLLAANRAILGELDLSLVLQRIVEAARDLVGARYGALGVIGSDEHREQFIQVGCEDETATVPGELPEPRRTFLGVPLRLRDEIFGTLYLTDPDDGTFTTQDEELVLSLAATAGIAIENARLYDESRRRHLWSEASAQVSSVLLSAPYALDLDPLQPNVDSVQRLADADVVTLVAPSPVPGEFQVVVAAGQGADQLLGLRYPAENTLVALTMEKEHGLLVRAVHEKLDRPIHLTRWWTWRP